MERGTVPVTNSTDIVECDNCKDWGRTVTRDEGLCVPCPKCKRLTYANLGVNCPAGMAVAWGASHAIEMEQTRQLILKPLAEALPKDAEQLNQEAFKAMLGKRGQRPGWWSHSV
jgi:hypothetical protein